MYELPSIAHLNLSRFREDRDGERRRMLIENRR